MPLPSKRPPPGAKHTAKTRSQVKAAWERGMAVTDIATSTGVDRTTVYAWARAGGWERPQPEPESEPEATGATRQIDATPPDIDQILAETIADLRRGLALAIRHQETRALPNLATAIVRCLESWERRHPATPAALAMLAVEMGLKPRVFMDAVVEQWRLKSGDNCELED